jgi:hypothetical protein
MTISVRQVFDVGAVNRQLSGPMGSITRDMFRRGLRVQERAKRLVAVDTGRLRDSINVSTLTRPVLGIETVVVRIGTNVDYAPAVHDGTGIYGPTGAPITPKNGKYLVFSTLSGSNKIGSRLSLVFVRSVRGQPGTEFLKKALREVRR